MSARRSWRVSPAWAVAAVVLWVMAMLATFLWTSDVLP